MFQTSFVNRTPSSQILVNVKITTTESSNLKKFENKCNFDKLCELGCPTYGNKWSCPPYSPSFSKYKVDDLPYAILALFWCTLDQFSYTKTDFIKVKASNSILKSRMDKFMRGLEDTLGGVILSNGSCRRCNPCNKKKGEYCKKPKEMRYSMESLGLNVSEISNEFFTHSLLWYKDKKIPEYSSVVSCLLIKDMIPENMLHSILLLSLH